MKNVLSTYKGLSKSAYTLCAATLINRLGDFVVPFLTMYLTIKLNMSTALSGIIVTIASVISIPSSFLGGKLSDSFGRKRIYLFGQCLSAVFLIFCGLINNAHVIIAFLLISTFFNGTVRPAFNALLIDTLPKEKRQEGMSLNYLCINLGVSVGPVIAGILFNSFLPLFFIGDGLTSLLSAALVYKNITEEKQSEDIKEILNNSMETKEEGNIFEILLKRPQLLMFFTLLLIYQFVYTQHRFTLPLSVTAQLHQHGAVVFGYMMSINAVTVVCLTVFVTAVMKNYHHLTCMILGGVFFAFGFGMIAYVHSEAGFFISTFVWSIGEIFNSISQGAFVADNSPINFRARISALHNVVFFIGSSLSTGFGGILIDKFGLYKIWTFIFILSVIAAFFMYCLKVYCIKKENKFYYEKEEDCV